MELEEGDDLKFSTTVPAADIDILSYVNSKFVYVEKHIKRQINALYMDVIAKKCALERKVLGNTLSIGAQKPEEFALRLKGRPGYIGILAGEVIYVAKCTPTLVDQRETKDCFNELPVSRNGEALFLTPRTRILTNIAVKIPCDEKFPPVCFINDQYVKFLPVREIAETPNILKPEINLDLKYNETKFIIRAGIYTPRIAQLIKERTMFPIEQMAVLSTVALGMLGRDVPDQLSIVPFLENEEVEGVLTKTWGKVWGKFLIFGTASAGIMGLYIIGRIVKFILDTGIHALTLYEIYGFSFHLLGAVWDSVTQLLLHWGNSQDQNTKKRKFPWSRKSANSETISIPTEQISSQPINNAEKPSYECPEEIRSQPYTQTSSHQHPSAIPRSLSRTSVTNPPNHYPARRSSFYEHAQLYPSNDLFSYRPGPV